MSRPFDALELLTAQHDEITALLARIAVPQPAAQRSEVLTQLADAVTLHLAVEQELFYPAVGGLMTTDVHAAMLREHGEIKRILATLLWLEDDEEQLTRALTALQIVFARHTSTQERELFEACAERTSTEHLATLGGEITMWLDRHVIADPVRVSIAA